MKILHIGNLKSGIDTYVRNSVAFASNDFEFVVVSGADDCCDPYLRGGKPVKHYTICMYRALNPVKDMHALIQAINIIRNEKPDLVHCHSAKGGVIGRFAAFVTGTKSAYTAHAFSFLSASSKKKQYFYLILEKIAKLKSILLACSESERNLGVEKVGYKQSKAFVWNNAIPAIKYEDIKQPKEVADDENYIISIGRPSYQKNPLLMVEIMRRLHEKYPNLKLYLLGVGYYSPMLHEMKELIRHYQAQNYVRLLPWISHSETLGYLKNAELYLTTSLYEGLPIAVLEAMAMKKAIVASDVIGNRDCVKDKYNGFLLPLDADVFANKICELLEKEDERIRIGDNSYSLFEKYFLIDNRIKNLEDIYKRVIELK